ncbi:MAG: hypothetical protein H0U52_12880 [Chloroflexi bacterium]|nr:hypothetical protein [Chloroflexota bacterium]
MESTSATDIIAAWPEEAREAADLVVKAYGEPHESTESALTWSDVGPWKRVVAQRAFWPHAFPAPHTDSVETFVDYRVPPEMFTPLAQFDGSVMVERTSGEVSARCHDEQANSLALNLMHDIVTGQKTAGEARDYYAAEFLDARRKQPTPYMDKLNFTSASSSAVADPDERVLSDEQLTQAEDEGKGRPTS